MNIELYCRMKGEDGYGSLGPDKEPVPSEEFPDLLRPVKEPRNFRLEWAAALLFGSYEVTID